MRNDGSVDHVDLRQLRRHAPVRTSQADRTLPLVDYFCRRGRLAIYYGLRHENDITKGFGITFLGINLYTRFFELFWNNLRKAVFFALLAVSFWYIGSKAETIWNLAKEKRTAATEA
jgi:hypothetical protein